MTKRIGLIAGIGRLPVEFAKSARKLGYEVVTIAVVPEPDDELALVSDVYYSISAMKAGKVIQKLKQERIEKLVFLGKVTKETIFTKWFIPDLRAIKILARLRDRSDDAIMLAIVGELAKEGISVADQTELLRQLFIDEGVYSKRCPNESEEDDITIGLKMAKAISGLDIGQTVVIKDSAVVAVEAIEGTNKCILRAGTLVGDGAVIVKVAKPQQDNRFDVPAVGVETIEAMREAGAKVLVVEAGQTLVVDLERTVALADKYSMSFAARKI